MAITKKQKDTNSEATIILTINVSDILKLPNDEEKAMKQIESEKNRLIRALKKVSGVDDIDVIKEKVFPNIKSDE